MTRPNPSAEEMRNYLIARPYVPAVRGGWIEGYVAGLGMRWTFFPRDRRRRVSDDYSLELAYAHAVSGRFDM
jgi:hypothetical protein